MKMERDRKIRIEQVGDICFIGNGEMEDTSIQGKIKNKVKK